MMRIRAQRKETFGLRAWRDKNAGGVLEQLKQPAGTERMINRDGRSISQKQGFKFAAS